MKKRLGLLFAFLLILFCTTGITRADTLYEDAEDGTTSGWNIYDDDPAGATITNVFDADRGNNVIELIGTERLNGFHLANEDGSDWDNTSEFVVQWSMKYAEAFTICITLNTTAGSRIITYKPEDVSNLGTGDYIYHGLGSNVDDGQWHTFVRDLSDDLEAAQPGVTILAVNGFYIRGSGRVDDINLLNSMPNLSISDVTINEEAGVAQFTITASKAFNTDISVDFETQEETATADRDYVSVSDTAVIPVGSTSTTIDVTINDDTEVESDETFSIILKNPVNAGLLDATGVATIINTDVFNPSIPTVYEDAEDNLAEGWSVYDNDPAGATITNVFDADRNSRVIQFSGSGTLNGYQLSKWDGSDWNNTGQFVVQWSMKYSDDFTVFIAVDTDAGSRILGYEPRDVSDLGSDEYVYHGLGSSVADGQWHTFARDLRSDLEEAQPGITILAVNGFYMRGTGRVDDILLMDSIASLSIDNVSVNEEAGLAQFTITASQPSNSDVTVHYSTIEETATADRDYVSASGTAIIPAGSTSTTIDITLNDDTEVETDETFSVLLDNPGNAILSDAMGSATILNTDVFNPTIPSIYEDAEDTLTEGWHVYDNDPPGATISNVYDTDRGSQVIQVSGSEQLNGFQLSKWNGDDWNNTGQFVAEWSLKYSETFTVYFTLDTSAGSRVLAYESKDSTELGNEEYVYHCLGSQAADGQWHTFTRDLRVDLAAAQPGVSIIAVNGFYIRGSGLIDDITLMESTSELTIGDVTVDEEAGIAQFTISASASSSVDISVAFDTAPGSATADRDYTSTSGTAIIPAGSTSTTISVPIIEDAEVEADETFTVNLSNAVHAIIIDNSATATIANTDVSNPAQPSIYEDAEDGLTEGWSVYDNDPVGATITNIYDTDRNSRVIVLNGSGTSNGYRFAKWDGSDWNNTDQFVVEWSMKYAEDFTVFITLDTSAGSRILGYKPVDESTLGTDEYVYHGLGAGVNDGLWHTFTRDLSEDLAAAQPDVTILAVKGFYIRGSGLIDDITLRQYAVTIWIPDMINQTQTNAETAITDNSLIVGDVSSVCDDTIAAGNVISSNPAAGTPVGQGALVDLVVSTGLCDVPVPNVVNVAQADAETAITSAGLSVGQITSACSDTVPLGSVISSNPAAGASVTPGTAVDIVVSSGLCPVLVPDVVGASQAEAVATITGEGLTPGNITETCDANIPAGNVISSNPAAGVSVPPSTTVSLVVSSGPCTVPVPDVVNQPQNAAQTAITDLGLTIGDITNDCSNTITTGNVIRTIPASGSNVLPGSAVALVVSSGPCTVTVPDVVGAMQAEAEANITSVSLTLGSITETCANDVEAGHVISSTPSAGEEVEPGTSVALVVSNGPCTVPVPDVVGMTQANAETQIVNGSLTVGNVSLTCSDTLEAGLVISSNPTGGNAIAPGSVVDLVVSSGICSSEVPDVIGTLETEAVATITNSGLTVGEITSTCSNAIPEGKIISSNPVAGTHVIDGATVTLVVSSGPCTVLVPDVMNMPQADAVAAITAGDLVAGEISTVCSDTIPAGNVISTHPTIGSEVVPQTTVSIVVSSGPCTVAVPNMVGSLQAEAEEAITSIGLVLGNITEMHHETIPAGSVISSDPVADTVVPLGSTVNLAVSTGPDMVVVPDVANTPQAEAESNLTTAGLTLGDITTVCDDTIAAGNVISSDPAAGSSVAMDSAVNLVVSGGTGRVHNVDQGTCFDTIQEAVNNANAGDTIQVEAGTYNEQVTIDKALTLLGAQAGNSPHLFGDNPRPDWGNESLIFNWPKAIIATQDPAGMVTIDGFMIIGKVKAKCEEFTFVNNIVFPKGKWGSLFKALVNIGFEGITKHAIVQDNDISPEMDDAQWPDGSHALQIVLHGIGASAFIDNNHLHNASKTLDADNEYGSGLKINADDPDAVITITNNEVDSNGKDGIATDDDATIDSLIVEDNDIYDNAACGVKINPNVAVHGEIHVNYNQIEGNGEFGVKNENNAITVDAKRNNWGDETGPSGGVVDPDTGNVANGNGDAVSEHVTFDPTDN